ncbi:hypothetical protein MHD_04535 [Mannheimia granulomatis]|uniref:Uncharacterized protein n=1 Tax=Mannheimia granulomatis TaxID=85402 RepID=A0A011NAH3_9PAST|nr:hypothetical protein AK33_09685 [Mannheimia granulomatis]RGE48389.1 hypothetical protein MHD_04535 [Mannheimia granulomatis]
MLAQFTQINDEALKLVTEIINQYAEICERPKVN